MGDKATAPTYRRQDMLTVSQITKEIPGVSGGPCSRRHVYDLIERGDLTPAFRFGVRRGICVPKQVVEKYKQRCLIDPCA